MLTHRKPRARTRLNHGTGRDVLSSGHFEGHACLERLEIPEEPWLELITMEEVATAFRCDFCGLALEGREELTVASLPENFVRTEVREPEYEPEYGND